jgi:hypothetical protein
MSCRSTAACRWARAGFTLAVVLALAGSAAADESARLVITQAEQEEPALAKVRAALLASGVRAEIADHALRGFDNYIDRRLKAAMKTVIYPEAVVELTRLASRSGWPGTEIGTFLAYVQAEMDEEGEAPSVIMVHASRAIRASRSAAGAIDSLERQEAVRRRGR